MQKSAHYVYRHYPHLNKYSCSVQVEGIFYGDNELSNTKDEAKLAAEVLAKDAFYSTEEEDGVIDFS